MKKSKICSAGAHVGRVSLCLLVFAGLISAFQPVGVADTILEKDRLISFGNDRLQLILQTDGSMTLKSKTDKEIMQIVPLLPNRSMADRLISCETIDSSDDQTKLEVTFGAATQLIQGIISFDRKGTVTLKPGRNMGGVAISTDMEYAVIPSRWVAETIYRPDHYPPGAELHLPPENLFVGLAPGGNQIIVLVWQSGSQQVRLVCSGGGEGARLFQAVEVMLGGREIHIGALDAPGIWHQVNLSQDQMEKDIAVDWERPFPARWITQIRENFREQSVPATFWFKGGKPRRRWWPTVSTHQWPVWFQGEKAFFHLTEKLSPIEGATLIYPLDGHPNTPFEFLKRVLSPDERQKITELGPTRYFFGLCPDLLPRVWEGTCAGRNRMKATILKVGAHFREREFMQRQIESRVIDNTKVVGRQIQRYQDLLSHMTQQFQKWMEKEKDSPEALSCLEEMRKGLRELEEIFRNYMHGKTPAEYIAYYQSIAEKLKEAVQQDGRERLAEMRSLVHDLNRPRGAEEALATVYGAGLQNWFMEVGHACVDCPATVKYALEIREAIRKLLEFRHYETRIGAQDMR